MSDSRHTQPESAAILVGSYVGPDGERRVAVSIRPNNATLTVEGARLLAKQINEWADHAEKNQPTVTMRWRVVLDDLLSRRKPGPDHEFTWTKVEMPAVEPKVEAKPKPKQTKRSASKRARAEARQS